MHVGCMACVCSYVELALSIGLTKDAGGSGVCKFLSVRWENLEGHGGYGSEKVLNVYEESLAELSVFCSCFMDEGAGPLIL